MHILVLVVPQWRDWTCSTFKIQETSINFYMDNSLYKVDGGITQLTIHTISISC